MNRILGCFLCVAILFVWGYVSWMVLPFHENVAKKFADESEVAEAIRKNAPQAGVYYLPFDEEDHTEGETAAFINALPDGYPGGGMAKEMLLQAASDLAVVLIILFLLLQTSGLDYWRRVAFVTLVGAVVAIAGHLPDLNWFKFPAPYVLLAMSDSLVGAFLSGLVIAKMAGEENPAGA